MKLTFEQIISATNGIVRAEENDIGLELHRFTKEQIEFFSKAHPLYSHDSYFDGYFARNCRTSAGITIDFVSDTKEFKIKFAKTEQQKGKTTNRFDLYIDNIMVQSYLLQDEITYKSSGENHLFTLYFPYFAFPIISSIELKNATVFLPQKKQNDILFLGDSITHGVRAVHPSETYVMRVARILGAGIVNQGNSGFVYDVGSVDKVCEPKIVVTAYGINDYMRKNLDSLKRDTIDFLKKVRETYKNAKIVSILPLWTNFNSENKEFKNTEKACLESIYEQYSDYTIDGHDLIPHDAKYFDDGIHPNDEGFEFYGNNLAKKLASII